MLKIKKIKLKDSELLKQAIIELLQNWKSHLFTARSDNRKGVVKALEIVMNLS
jgi:hypothetical protein